jgi:MoaA/NifB/PqqE/SkfB family radical SAM enzyme
MVAPTLSPRSELERVAAGSSSFRLHPLDGARLYFDRSTGLHVRLDGPTYADERRRAPRVVQIGLTNHCNLRCGFCFRDRTLRSAWTAPALLEWAQVLARAGVLELGFGQGEPLLFPGFPALVRTIARETELAVNFTTNGLRLGAGLLDEFDGAFGQLRLSYYEDNDPLARVRLLARQRARFGVNLLVTPAALATLQDTLEALHDAGCDNVLLLSYNGPDAALQLSPRDDRALARIILEMHARHAATLTLGLSVCFGRRLSEVPQLRVPTLGGDDCGAGEDFITIDSEQRLLPCSFHTAATPLRSPAHALAVWHEQRARRMHAGLEGCMRPRLRVAREPHAGPAPLPRVQVWQAFAANHSTSYTLVGEFPTAAGSAAYVAEMEALLQRCAAPPEPPRPAPETLWQALGREGEPADHAWTASPRDLANWSPDALLAGGRRVLVHCDSTLQTFRIYAHQLLRFHGRILAEGDLDFQLAFGIVAGEQAALVERDVGRLCTALHVAGPRIYGLVACHELRRLAPIFRRFELPRAIALTHRSDETLAAALAERLPLPSRKRRVEWMLVHGLPADHWRDSFARFTRDPAASLAAIDWPHPFRLPDRIDAHALLGHTLLRSEGAPFPGALQAWLYASTTQLVARPELRLRFVVREGSEQSRRPLGGLTAAHVAALSLPGGSYKINEYSSIVDVIPKRPAAAITQLDRILGELPRVGLDIMPARPLADAIARIEEDLDQATR